MVPNIHFKIENLPYFIYPIKLLQIHSVWKNCLNPYYNGKYAVIFFVEKLFAPFEMAYVEIIFL